MYLHLGNNTVALMRDIIGIFDFETTTTSKISREYLTKAQKSGEIIDISDELPKSYIICSAKDGKNIVYTSQISSATLFKRSSYKNLK